MKKIIALVALLFIGGFAQAGTFTITFTGENIDNGSVAVELLAGYTNNSTSYTMGVVYAPEPLTVPNSMSPQGVWSNVGEEVQTLMAPFLPRLTAWRQAGKITNREIKEWLVDEYNKVQSRKRLDAAHRVRLEVFNRIRQLQGFDREYKLEALP